MKNRVLFITKESNSFGDQILKFFVNGQLIEIFNCEGSHESIKDVTRRLENDRKYKITKELDRP